MAKEEFDYIIIGAGSSGCVLAYRLTEDPSVKVLLLEAGGPDRDPLIHIPLGVGKMWQHRMHDWGYDTEPEAHWYAKSGKPETFIGGDVRTGIDMPIGTDYQAQWHQQKMRDANYMANAKVKATLVARAKAFSSPNGYYQLPPRARSETVR